MVCKVLKSVTFDADHGVTALSSKMTPQPPGVISLEQMAPNPPQERSCWARRGQPSHQRRISRPTSWQYTAEQALAVRSLRPICAYSIHADDMSSWQSS